MCNSVKWGGGPAKICAAPENLISSCACGTAQVAIWNYCQILLSN